MSDYKLMDMNFGKLPNTKATKKATMPKPIDYRAPAGRTITQQNPAPISTPAPAVQTGMTAPKAPKAGRTSLSELVSQHTPTPAQPLGTAQARTTANVPQQPLRPYRAPAPAPAAQSASTYAQPKTQFVPGNYVPKLPKADAQIDINNIPGDVYLSRMLQEIQDQEDEQSPYYAALRSVINGEPISRRVVDAFKFRDDWGDAVHQGLIDAVNAGYYGQTPEEKRQIAEMKAAIGGGDNPTFDQLVWQKMVDVVFGSYETKMANYDAAWSSGMGNLQNQLRSQRQAINNYRTAMGANAAQEAAKTNAYLADYGLGKSAYGSPTSGYGEQSRMQHKLNLDNIKMQLNEDEREAVDTLAQWIESEWQRKLGDTAAMDETYWQDMQAAVEADAERRSAVEQYLEQAAQSNVRVDDYYKELYELYNGKGSYAAFEDRAVRNGISTGTISSLGQLEQFKGTANYKDYVSEFVAANGLTDELKSSLIQMTENGTIGKNELSAILKKSDIDDMNQNCKSADEVIESLQDVAKDKQYYTDSDFAEYMVAVQSKLSSLGGNTASDNSVLSVKANNGKDASETNNYIGRKFTVTFSDGSTEKYKVIYDDLKIDDLKGYEKGTVLIYKGNKRGFNGKLIVATATDGYWDVLGEL